MGLKKKHYAIYYPDGKSRILNSWEKTLKAVKGVKGIHYKSFDSIEKCQTWLSCFENSIPETETLSRDDPYTLRLYVDGSFSNRSLYAGFGWVIVQNETIIEQKSGKTPYHAQSRNIDGELYGVINALNSFERINKPEQISEIYNFQDKTKLGHETIKTNLPALKYNAFFFKTIIMFYDYAGIREWALGTWQSKSGVANQYRIDIEKYLPFLKWRKVKSHSNNRWNDIADKLAKKALELE